MDIISIVREFCIKKNIHEACLFCNSNCKNRYSNWSGCMPYSEYCDTFIESLISELLTKIVEIANKKK